MGRSKHIIRQQRNQPWKQRFTTIRQVRALLRPSLRQCLLISALVFIEFCIFGNNSSFKAFSTAFAKTKTPVLFINTTTPSDTEDFPQGSQLKVISRSNFSSENNFDPGSGSGSGINNSIGSKTTRPFRHLTLKRQRSSINLLNDETNVQQGYEKSMELVDLALDNADADRKKWLASQPFLEIFKKKNRHIYLAGCELKLNRTLNRRHRISKYYGVTCHALPVEGIEIAIHRHDEELLMLQASIPWKNTDFTVNTASIEQASLGFQQEQRLDNFDNLIEKQLALCFHRPPRNDEISPASKLEWQLAPCWILSGQSVDNGITFRIVADSQTGELLSAEPQDFKIKATVFINGPQDLKPKEVSLENLLPGNFLDGTNLSVFAPRETDDRVTSMSSAFTFSPSKEALEFDQAQSYYGATRALNWFQTEFNHDFGNSVFKIRVHANYSRGLNNARYVPDSGDGPEILLGSGDGKLMRNLARDPDVIAHELSHHIIFQRLKSSRGESGLIHESYADYFAYAMRNEPTLGSTVKVGSPWLRTAAIEMEFRFDDPTLGWKPHQRAQIISAVLWDTRLQIGPDMDKIVYHSIDYLEKKSGLADAFIAIMNADRDLFPLTPETPEVGVYGVHKCEILKAAVFRGFAKHLKDMDGTSCDLDIPSLIAESNKFSEEQELNSKNIEGRDKKNLLGDLKIFGQTCAVVAAKPDTRAATLSFYMTLAILLLPLFAIRLSNSLAEKRLSQ